MAKAMVECRVCKQKFNRLDPELVEGEYWVKPVNLHYYHKKCYEDFAKKKGQIGKDGIEFEADEMVWKAATEDYLKRDLKVSIDYKRFNSQWKRLVEKDGRTPKGIYFTLRYFYDVCRGLAEKSEGGIGIVSHVYEDATAYWGERNQKDKGIVARIEQQIKEAAAQNIIKVNLKKPKKQVKTAAEALAAVDMEDEE
jgi:hypothetical protein